MAQKLGLSLPLQFSENCSSQGSKQSPSMNSSPEGSIWPCARGICSCGRKCSLALKRYSKLAPLALHWQRKKIMNISQVASMMSQAYLDTSHGVGICTMEIGKLYKWRLLSWRSIDYWASPQRIRGCSLDTAICPAVANTRWSMGNINWVYKHIGILASW